MTPLACYVTFGPLLLWDQFDCLPFIVCFQPLTTTPTLFTKVLHFHLTVRLLHNHTLHWPLLYSIWGFWNWIKFSGSDYAPCLAHSLLPSTSLRHTHPWLASFCVQWVQFNHFCTQTKFSLSSNWSQFTLSFCHCCHSGISHINNILTSKLFMNCWEKCIET